MNNLSYAFRALSSTTLAGMGIAKNAFGVIWELVSLIPGIETLGFFTFIAIGALFAASPVLQAIAIGSFAVKNYYTAIGNQEDHDINSLANGKIPETSLRERFKNMSLKSHVVAPLSTFFLSQFFVGSVLGAGLMYLNGKFSPSNNEKFFEEAAAREQAIITQLSNTNKRGFIIDPNNQLNDQIFDILEKTIIPRIAEFRIKQSNIVEEKNTNRLELYAASALFFKKELGKNNIIISKELFSSLMKAVLQNRNETVVKEQLSLNRQEYMIDAVSQHIFGRNDFNKDNEFLKAAINVSGNDKNLRKVDNPFVKALAATFERRSESEKKR